MTLLGVALGVVIAAAAGLVLVHINPPWLDRWLADPTQPTSDAPVEVQQ